MSSIYSTYSAEFLPHNYPVQHSTELLTYMVCYFSLSAVVGLSYGTTKYMYVFDITNFANLHLDLLKQH